MMDWENLSLLELEQQMSPSRWNPNKTENEVIQQYINVSLEGTKIAREKVPCQLDIAYGVNPTQKFDLYGTDLPDDAPIFFFIHGGYWQEGSKDLAGTFAILNRENAFKSIAFGYTLAPAVKIGQMQLELVMALKKIAKDTKSKAIVLCGHSAGGQLVAHLLYSSMEYLPKEVTNKIVGMILISGVFDLRPLVKTYVNDMLGMSLNEASSLSVLLKTRPDSNTFNLSTLKIMIIVGEYDSPEFQRQSRAYYEKLREVILQTTFFKSPDDDHFTLIEKLQNESTVVTKMVKNFLKSCII